MHFETGKVYHQQKSEKHKSMKMFIDTVHFSARRHFGVVLDSEGFILGKTVMFRTKQQAWDTALVLRDKIMAKDAKTLEQLSLTSQGTRPSWTHEHEWRDD